MVSPLLLAGDTGVAARLATRHRRFPLEADIVATVNIHARAIALDAVGC